MISVMDNWPQILITESSQSKSSQITQQSCGSFMSIHHYSSQIWHRHEAHKALPWTWLFTLFEVTQKYLRIYLNSSVWVISSQTESGTEIFARAELPHASHLKRNLLMNAKAKEGRRVNALRALLLSQNSDSPSQSWCISFSWFSSWHSPPGMKAE